MAEPGKQRRQAQDDLSVTNRSATGGPGSSARGSPYLGGRTPFGPDWHRCRLGVKLEGPWLGSAITVAPSLLRGLRGNW